MIVRVLALVEKCYSQSVVFEGILKMKARLSLTLGLVLAAFSATAMSAQAGF